MKTVQLYDLVVFSAKMVLKIMENTQRANRKVEVLSALQLLLCAEMVLKIRENAKRANRKVEVLSQLYLPSCAKNCIKNKGKQTGSKS